MEEKIVELEQKIIELEAELKKATDSSEYHYKESERAWDEARSFRKQAELQSKIIKKLVE
jgi:hypothetical protein